MLARAVAVLAVSAAAAAQIDPALLAGLKARAIGPAGMSGRVAAIDAVVADPDVIWVGAATGGVWKSTNGGITFAPMFDDQPVAAIGAVAVFQPSPDVVWVGTGEGNPRNSASVGNGVYRSLDGGRTWRHLGLEHSERIHRIVLHPDDRDTAYAAALGPTWGDGEQRGVFKTTDGGATWTKVLWVDARTGCADLAMDPANPDKLFAAMWEHRREPHFFHSGGPGSGLWTTHDGGATWRRLGEQEGLPRGELGRIGIAFAPSDPRIVYALVEAKKNALLRSDDGGESWRIVTEQPDVANRPFYYCDLRVDPERPDRVYNLASTLRVSDDGGKTFARLANSVHPDHHALWIHPADPTLLLEGNDGGVAISRDRGRSWQFVASLPLAQLYHIDVDMEVPYHVYGGMQDNGSWRGPSSVWENGGIRNHHWEEVGFGDGFRTLADPQNATTGYAMSQQGYVHRWDLRTGERKAIRPAPAAEELRFNWNAAIAIDPFDPGTIYFGSQLVHRSQDRGETWEAISGDLTTDNPDWQKQDESGGLSRDVTGAENYTTIVTIGPSPVARGELWVGTDDGRIHVTTDGGATWSSVEGNVPGVPAHTWVPHIEPSRFRAGAAFAVFDDHRRSNWAPYVYRTLDHGRTWTSLATGDLRGYALSIAQDPIDEDLLFLGTEFGLWFTIDGGASWLPFRHGVPTVSVMALEIHPREHDLVLGTHGRAVFVVDDIRPLRELTADVMRAPLHLFAIADAQQYQVKQSAASRFPGDGEYRGDNRPYGALIAFVAHDDALPLPEDAEKQSRRPPAGDGGEQEEGALPKVKVVVHDANGARVCKFERRVVRGLNRITWNLRRDEFRRPRERDEPRPSDSDPRGPEVPAGLYRLTVSRGEHTAEGTVRVLPDPRTDVTDADRAAKWQAILEVGRWQELATECVERIDEARDDADLVLRKAKRIRDRHDGGDPPPHEELVAAAKALQKSLDELTSELRGPRDLQGIGPRKHVLGRVGEAMRSLPSSWDAPDPAQQRYMQVAREAVEAALPSVNRVLSDELAQLRTAAEAAGLGLFAARDAVRLPP